MISTAPGGVISLYRSSSFPIRSFRRPIDGLDQPGSQVVKVQPVGIDSRERVGQRLVLQFRHYPLHERTVAASFGEGVFEEMVVEHLRRDGLHGFPQLAAAVDFQAQGLRHHVGAKEVERLAEQCTRGEAERVQMRLDHRQEARAERFDVPQVDGSITASCSVRTRSRTLSATQVAKSLG